MPTNPYRATSLRKIEIVYEGEASGYHCYRVKLRGHAGMDAHNFKNQIQAFLLGASYGTCHFGNRLGTQKDEPTLPFENPDGADFFVAFSGYPDMVLFENRFEVTGYSPVLIM